MRWDLTNLTPKLTAVEGSIFEIQVLVLGGNYQIIAPRVIVPNTTTISGIHVLIQRQAQLDLACELVAGEAWTAVSATINASSIPNPLPSTPLNATPLVQAGVDVLLPVLSPNDLISIGFETL